MSSVPLTQDQEEQDFALRIEQMQTSIDNTRLNMKKLENDLRWESRKFAVQLVLGVAACVGAGAALANYVNGRSTPAPAPQVIILQPRAGSPLLEQVNPHP